MEELLEIARIIARDRLKKIEIIGNSAPKHGKEAKQSKYSKAYHALLEGKLTSDEVAAAYLGFKEANKAYFSFKRRFAQKLLNTLFHIEVTFSDYNNAEYECSRLRHVVYMLFLYGYRNTAVQFLGKILGIALKYDLAYYKMFCYKWFREHYSYTGDTFRYQKNSGLYDKALDQMILEEKAEDFLNRINVRYARTIAQKPEMAAEAFKHTDEIEAYLKVHDTHLLQYYRHKLQSLGHEIDNDYEKSNDIWDKWEVYLQQHPLFAGDKRFGEVAMYKMHNYIYLFQYDQAKKCAMSCLKYFRHDSSNRLIFLENYFLFAMRCGDYINARHIFHLAEDDKRLHTMPVAIQEKWKIFELYLFYIEGNKNGVTGPKTGSEFDLDDLLKDIKVYKKDKEGFKVSILIVQICILIRFRPNTKPIDEMDALRLYKKRYLKTDISYRVNVFMDLLFALDKAYYSFSAIKKEEAQLLKKLEEKQHEHTLNIEGLEVIPFEKFWEMVKG